MDRCYPSSNSSCGAADDRHPSPLSCPGSTPTCPRRSTGWRTCCAFRRFRPTRRTPPMSKAAADWLVKDLTDMGFSARKDPTTGHPMVVATGGADRRAASAVLRPLRRTAGRPAGPVGPRPVRPASAGHAARKSDPRARRVRRQGPVDDLSGSLPRLVDGAWQLPVKLTFFLEGEEESGSPSLVPYMNRECRGAESRCRADLRHRHV